MPTSMPSGVSPGRRWRPAWTAIGEAAAAVGRTLRYSLSLRPIIADTEDEAWEKAEWIAEKTAERIALAKERMAGHKDTYEASAAPATPRSRSIATPGGTTSVGRKRLIEMSADRDVYDERLWMKVANLTGAAGNSTALVGTPEQVAEAMLRYYDLGHHHLAAEGLRSLGRRHRLREGAPPPGAGGRIGAGRPRGRVGPRQA